MSDREYFRNLPIELPGSDKPWTATQSGDKIIFCNPDHPAMSYSLAEGLQVIEMSQAIAIAPDDFDDDDFGEDEPYCERCSNTGTIDCHCGGDQCYCDNQGEKPCPKCDRGF